MYSKLTQLNRDLHFVISKDGYKRSMPFCKLLPKVKEVEYGEFDYKFLKRRPQDIQKDFLENTDKIVYLTANEHLDNGGRIEKYLPELPTDHYYKIEHPAEAEEKAERLLADCIYPLGIAMAHKDVNNAWNGWTPLEWLVLIKTLRKKFPYMTPVLIGAFWDRNLSNKLIKYLEAEHIEYIDLVGKLSLAESLAVIRRLPFFFSFASGLSILAVKEKVNTVMLYPEKLRKLMYAWCPYESLIKGWYMPSLWERPIDILTGIRQRLEETMPKPK